MIGGLIGKITGWCSNHSTEILTVAGVVGIGVTAYYTSEARLKAEKVIKNEEKLQKRELEFDEKLKLTYKCYIPAVGWGIGTASCIVGVNTIHGRRNAALTAAYGLTERAYRQYQEQVINKFGENAHKEMKKAVVVEKAKEELRKPGPRRVIGTRAGGGTMCYDSMTGRAFYSSKEHIRGAINDINQMLDDEEYLSLNDYFDELGMENCDAGEDLGWSSERERAHVQFESILVDGQEPALLVILNAYPNFR